MSSVDFCDGLTFPSITFTSLPSTIHLPGSDSATTIVTDRNTNFLPATTLKLFHL